jgi:transposase
MLTVETIARVRREHAKGKSVRAIARDLRLSRDTVTKYLRSDDTEGKYERHSQPFPQLGPFLAELEQLLERNERQQLRERLDKRQLFEALRRAGYVGGYDAVRRYARRWAEARTTKTEAKVTEAFIPLIFAPGEAYQFDWSEEWIVLDGVAFKAQVAQVRLCHSRMPYIRAYPRQTQEMVFDAHARAFAFWVGTCERGIYDNMKTAVDAVFVGKDRKFNRRFAQMCSHYLVEPTACTPAAGWEKGQVENQVGSQRQRLFIPRPHVKTLDELNRQLEDGCLAHARESRHPDDRERSVWEVFEAERAVLVPVRGPFDGFREVTASASKTCLVRFDRNRYSIEARAANRPVQLRAYADRVVVRFDGEVVAEHERLFGRDRVRYDPLHYLPVLAKKPGALRNGAPFKDWELPPNLAKLRARLGRSDEADRQFVGVLAAIPEDGLEAVEEACRLALAEGLCRRDAVLNILSRSCEGAPPPALATPPTPPLRLVPAADCARYDRLRTITPEVDRGAA